MKTFTQIGTVFLLMMVALIAACGPVSNVTVQQAQQTADTAQRVVVEMANAQSTRVSAETTGTAIPAQTHAAETSSVEYARARASLAAQKTQAAAVQMTADANSTQVAREQKTASAAATQTSDYRTQVADSKTATIAASSTQRADQGTSTAQAVAGAQTSAAATSSAVQTTAAVTATVQHIALVVKQDQDQATADAALVWLRTLLSLVFIVLLGALVLIAGFVISRRIAMRLSIVRDGVRGMVLVDQPLFGPQSIYAPALMPGPAMHTTKKDGGLETVIDGADKDTTMREQEIRRTAVIALAAGSDSAFDELAEGDAAGRWQVVDQMPPMLEPGAAQPLLDAKWREVNKDVSAD